MEKIFYFLLFFILLPGKIVQADTVANSRTTFKGMITVSTCNIVVGDDNQTVDMGQISSAELDARGQSAPIFFAIQLYGCSSSDKIVKTLFEQSEGGANGSIIPVNGVSGIGLTLQDGAGNPIYLNQSSKGQKIQAGDNVLLYSVRLVKTGVIQAGSYSRLLHYTLSYE
ncbi:fimbrial protein [Providencia vermicola]|uniref:fimbrial protein n=1 Tax=Providencia vermicola TaxID=333965 RepID=UPI002AB5B71A|nr:type 1 fimbrial protein [Providencia stuartii]